MGRVVRQGESKGHLQHCYCDTAMKFGSPFDILAPRSPCAGTHSLVNFLLPKKGPMESLAFKIYEVQIVVSQRAWLMEVPVPAHSSSSGSPSVKVRNCTSPISWRSCFSDQRLAIASTRILRVTDFRLLFCKARTPPNSSPPHNGGKHSQPPSPRRSDAPLLARESTPHNPSTKSPSALLKKSSGGKGLVSTSPNSKAQARTLSTVHSAGLGPRLEKAPSVRPPRKKHKHKPLSQVQVEEDKARKQAEGKERIAMAEANGFRLSKRSKKNPEEFQHVLKLNLCSKYGDLHGALEIYDRVHTGGVFKFKQHQYNVLLYICSGAASGNLVKAKRGKISATADTFETITQSMKDSEGAVEEAEEGEDGKDLNVASFSPEEMQLAARRGTEIYEDMLRAKISPNEATFTAVARLAVAKGDGDLAFETVKKMAVAGMVPKLRTYGPALLCFCEHNEIEKAFEVDDHMVAAGVLPDENLLEALLRLSIAAGLEAKVYVLLQRLRKTVRDVSPLTLTTIERWFNSEAAASVSSLKVDNRPSEEDIRKAAESRGGGWHGLGWLGEGKWVTKRTTISTSGVCQSCGETLCTVDLDPEETEKFANSVGELAMQRERNPNEFVTFQQWLGKKGPFEAVIDGANIGMYNSALRGFNYNQVATVANAIKARSLIEKLPLVVLHCRRTSDRGTRSPRSQNIIDSWVNRNVLYSTPHGSNDDWYWLYAAVKCKSLLVTNDEMRDHLFELLGNNFFPKWKERHQVRFAFSPHGLELLMPPPYSTIIQESQGGSWHIPQSGADDVELSREWLCVTRSTKVLTELKPSITSEQKSDIVTISNVKEQTSSETLRKLEAAERVSMSTVTYDI
ncbi:hypothetical protein L7F22_000380 [Adiantum nelumboides]|nr:hypothetical protein [Adiantum nelumboides]